MASVELPVCYFLCLSFRLKPWDFYHRCVGLYGGRKIKIYTEGTDLHSFSPSNKTHFTHSKDGEVFKLER